jgi:Nucleotidyl transferase AbiEii toxin, Type IV TA system
MTPSEPDHEGYKTPEAFRRAAAARLRAEAKLRQRPLQELRREFLFQRFLARVFVASDSPWVLKGGTGMVIRMPGARYSQDVDLMHPADGLDARWAVAQLRRGTGRSGRPPDIRCRRPSPPDRRAHTMARIAGTGYTGATRFDRFSVDLSGRSKLDRRPRARSPGSRDRPSRHDRYAPGHAVPIAGPGRRQSLTADLRDLDAALTKVRRCLSQLLTGEVRKGSWNPTSGIWT